MKLVVFMCVDEYAKDARELLRENKVLAYSESNIRGYKASEDDESENWFAAKHYPDNSKVFFTMVDEKKAEQLMNALEQCKLNKDDNGVHAFQLEIEKHIG
jgi:nitrogen regulatory protein PII-like uncharacterized protein